MRLPEIVAKKVVYRGAGIKPRDIFDIAASADAEPDATIAALRSFRAEVDATIERVLHMNPEFVVSAINQLMIRDGYRAMAETAIPRALELLRSV